MRRLVGRSAWHRTDRLRIHPWRTSMAKDSFSYRVTDGEDSSEVATVSLVINSVNDLPVAVADSYFTLPGVPLNVQADRGVLANDSDVDGPEARAILETAPSNGQLQLMPDGSLTYTPNEGFLGTDLFSYRFDDGLDRSAVTEVELSVSTRPVLISELNCCQREWS